ncbi:RNA polymerase sigma-70 factor (ECF subfamily) [Granulicella aggregans]|uniref:RNA polymerase sigma-70 factor (ECF subfamily) n=1 Tax=Granulicella aggregans TaxID=474949 RepID=A0A7W7ZK67_9BACT|nr:RNA polymerase sigma-70 factor (ECF subfamily) [Granulicella aggregans]
MNEQEQWTRIVAGDAQAFTAFYQATAPRSLAFLQRMVGSREAVEDVAQETYAGIWRHPGGYRRECGTVRGYLFGAGRKRAQEWWRMRGPVMEEVVETAAEAGVESQAILLDTLDCLPTEQRTLLWLREIEGLSYDELAEALDIPLGTVRSRLFTAREALRRIWFDGRKGEHNEM